MAKQLRGCIVFTSSAAACIVSPFTSMYAATKSFISSFGAALAVEVRHHGIDVLVFHPSPVNSRWVPPSCVWTLDAPHLFPFGCECNACSIVCRMPWWHQHFEACVHVQYLF